MTLAVTSVAAFLAFVSRNRSWFPASALVLSTVGFSVASYRTAEVGTILLERAGVGNGHGAGGSD